MSADETRLYTQRQVDDLLRALSTCNLVIEKFKKTERDVQYVIGLIDGLVKRFAILRTTGKEPNHAQR